MAQYARAAVSKKKRRFVEDGFDLDLSYITPRIIAMGFPSSNIEGLFRNPMEEVQRFFSERHPEHAKIFNLCSERQYDPAKFNGLVAHIPFDDHNVPPLQHMPALCTSAKSWLDADPDHVVAIHCKAGKGRTGLMVACLLLHLNMFSTAEDALGHFAKTRTIDRAGVTIGSQRRWVGYYVRMMHDPSLGLPPFPALRLHAVRLAGLPPGWWHLSFRVYMSNQMVYDSRVKGEIRSVQIKDPNSYRNSYNGGSGGGFLPPVGDNQAASNGSTAQEEGNHQRQSSLVHNTVDFDLRRLDLPLFNDSVKIVFYRHSYVMMDSDRLFYTWFHPSFVQENFISLPANQLDKLHGDLACDSDFKMEIYFEGHERALILMDTSQASRGSFGPDPPLQARQAYFEDISNEDSIVVLYQGTLKKRKIHASSSKSKISRWLKRFCILYQHQNNTKLRYFENKSSFKGEVDMCDVYHVSLSTSADTIFNIAAKNQMYEFEASSPEVANEWVDVMSVPVTRRLLRPGALDTIWVGDMFRWRGPTKDWRRVTTMLCRGVLALYVDDSARGPEDAEKTSAVVRAAEGGGAGGGVDGDDGAEGAGESGESSRGGGTAAGSKQTGDTQSGARGEIDWSTDATLEGAGVLGAKAGTRCVGMVELHCIAMVRRLHTPEISMPPSVKQHLCLEVQFNDAAQLTHKWLLIPDGPGLSPTPQTSSASFKRRISKARKMSLYDHDTSSAIDTWVTKLRSACDTAANDVHGTAARYLRASEVYVERTAAMPWRRVCLSLCSDFTLRCSPPRDEDDMEACLRPWQNQHSGIHASTVADAFDLRNAQIGIRAHDFRDTPGRQSDEESRTLMEDLSTSLDSTDATVSSTSSSQSYVLTVTGRGRGAARTWEIWMNSADEMLSWFDWLDIRDALGRTDDGPTPAMDRSTSGMSGVGGGSEPFAVEQCVCRQRIVCKGLHMWHRVWAVVYTSGLLEYRPLARRSVSGATTTDEDDEGGRPDTRTIHAESHNDTGQGYGDGYRHDQQQPDVYGKVDVKSLVGVRRWHSDTPMLNIKNKSGGVVSFMFDKEDECRAWEADIARIAPAAIRSVSPVQGMPGDVLLHSGWLQLQVKGMGTAQFKRRHFRLDSGGRLVSCKSAASVSSLSAFNNIVAASEVDTSIQLHRALGVRAVPSGIGRDNELEVRCPEETYVMKADDRNTRDVWVELLRSVAEKAREDLRNENVVFEGSLLKTGKVNTQYKRRHFRLTESGLLRYYKAQYKTGVSPQGEIDIRHVERVDTALDSANGRQLIMLVTQARTWKICADDRPTAEAWVRQIRGRLEAVSRVVRAAAVRWWGWLQARVVMTSQAASAEPSTRCLLVIMRTGYLALFTATSMPEARVSIRVSDVHFDLVHLPPPSSPSSFSSPHSPTTSLTAMTPASKRTSVPPSGRSGSRVIPESTSPDASATASAPTTPASAAVPPPRPPRGRTKSRGNSVPDQQQAENVVTTTPPPSAVPEQAQVTGAEQQGEADASEEATVASKRPDDTLPNSAEMEDEVAAEADPGQEGLAEEGAMQSEKEFLDKGVLDSEQEVVDVEKRVQEEKVEEKAEAETEQQREQEQEQQEEGNVEEHQQQDDDDEGRETAGEASSTAVTEDAPPNQPPRRTSIPLWQRANFVSHQQVQVMMETASLANPANETDVPTTDATSPSDAPTTDATSPSVETNQDAVPAPHTPIPSAPDSTQTPTTSTVEVEKRAQEEKAEEEAEAETKLQQEQEQEQQEEGNVEEHQQQDDDDEGRETAGEASSTAVTEDAPPNQPPRRTSIPLWQRANFVSHQQVQVMMETASLANPANETDAPTTDATSPSDAPTTDATSPSVETNQDAVPAPHTPIPSALNPTQTPTTSTPPSAPVELGRPRSVAVRFGDLTLVLTPNTDEECGKLMESLFWAAQVTIT